MKFQLSHVTFSLEIRRNKPYYRALHTSKGDMFAIDRHSVRGNVSYKRSHKTETEEKLEEDETYSWKLCKYILFVTESHRIVLLHLF
jgi:hypothetical protein